MSKNSRGKIVLTFESDWHVGTGTGIPGSTDKLIFRDENGFPAVPAKTLNGIWRDAMETLCDGLGKGWGKWVEFIFGIQPDRIDKNELKERLENNEKTYSFSILNLRPARISEKLRDAIGNDERLKQALTFIKAGIAVDSASGTAKENHLRFEEMGRSGTVLEAEFDLQTEDETAKALLVLSAGLIERIGGKRRRGAGKCRFEIEGLMTKDKALKYLKENAPPVPVPIAKTSNEIDLEKANDSTGWQTLEYRLTLQTPVSIVAAVLGNVSESLDFIPGTYLLPFITKNFGKKIRSAVANGDFQVSAATVEIDEERGFPIPKVFAQEKMDKSKVYNRLLETLEGKNQTKPIRGGFISDISSHRLSISATPQTLLIHNTVDDRVQRPTSAVGGVFSREAIKAGTVLRGEIRWKKSLNLGDKDFESLENYVRLGTSKKDDYGLAALEIIKPQRDFSAKSKLNEKDEDKNKLYVYLASDVLLRNDNLRQTNLVEDLAKKMGEILGITLSETKAEDSLISSIIHVRRIESWQVSWGFPRPTLTAMAAGSVVVFESKQAIDLTKLEEIEAGGIGERRGEGYGHIIFNPEILEASKPVWQKGKLTEAANATKTELLDDDFARQIELTAWREELKVAVLKIADEKELRKKIFGFDADSNSPPMAQIGSLRSVISRVRKYTDRVLVVNWLDHLGATANRKEKWSDESLKSIRDIFSTEEKVWEDLQPIFKVLPKLSEEKEILQNKLWAEAVRALFYACQHAHKRQLEKSERIKEAANG